jgi:hypothetical protein
MQKNFPITTNKKGAPATPLEEIEAVGAARSNHV